MKRKYINKRQCEDSDGSIGQELENHIKKVKISYTPGELRLKNDIKEVMSYEGVSIEQTETPSVAIILFKTILARIPNRYILSVPKFYPHNPPTVRCFDPTCDKPCRFWDGNGQIIHPGLSTEWTAMSSLQTVIQILVLIRSELLQTGHDHGDFVIDSSMDLG